MNNYLLQILKETKTIIIPGLGALTVTNEATGEIMFMSFLKHDDGNLAKYISEKDGVDLNDAKNLIAKYVREITAEIDKGDKYSMYQFGEFSKVDGEVVFEQWQGVSGAEAASHEVVVEENVVPIVEISEPEEIVAEQEPITAPEPVVEEPIVDEIIPIVEVPIETHAEIKSVDAVPEAKIEEQAPIVQQPIEDHSSFVVSPDIEPIKVEIVPEIPAAEEVVAPKIEEKAVEPIIEKANAPEKAAEAKKHHSPKDRLKEADKKKANEPKKKKKTGVFAYILWGFVVLILSAGTYVAFNYDNLKNDYPILAELTGEDLNEVQKDSLVSLGETDPVANPDSMPEVEQIPGNEQEEDILKEEPVSEPEPVKEKAIEKPAPKPVAKPKPVVKPVVKPTPKPKPVVKPVVKPKPVTTVKPVVNTGYTPRPKAASFPTPNLSNPYHIIAGSFSSKTNALNFATKLKGMGMSNLSVGQAGGLYKVSINGYATEDAAKAALPSLQGVAPNAWVFEWK